MVDNTDYKIHKIYSEVINYEVLVIELPEDELEDKLTYFSQDNGKIAKDYYDDYLLATCIANVNQILKKLSADADLENKVVDLEVFRNNMIGFVLQHNPLLNYDKIIINKSKVLKIKEEFYELLDGELRLEDNPIWLKGKEIKENKNIIVKDASIENVEDIKYTKEKMWWKRIGRYISVKKYKSQDILSLLKNRYFHNRTSFSTFVVTVCVIDFEELFQLLDNMGVPSRVAPPLLMHELYELCQIVNPDLTFDIAKDLLDTNDPSNNCETGKTNNKEATSGSSMGKYVDKPKQKKRFKDVPKEDLLNLASTIKVSLIGQDKAINSLTDAILRASVGLKDPVKPIGSFIFAGSTGCGKSLAARVLADELIQDKENLTIIDCSEYSADHEYSKLVGSPAGYVGYENGGILTNAIQKNPFSVVVFDEIEKASTKVFQLLLQVLDEGRLTDNKGTRVSFKDTVIIMTSNLGVKDIEAIGKTIGFGDVNKITKEKKSKAIETALKKKFKPEFLNRIDEIIYFNDLKKKDYEKIIDIELYKLNDNLQNNDTEYKNLTLDFDDKIKKLVYKNGISEEYGARPLKREIEKTVATPLAVKLLSGKVAKDSIIKISSIRNKVIFEEEKLKRIDAEPAPFYMSNGGEEISNE